LKISVTQLILQNLISIGMTVAVYFNDKKLLRAIEVHNVWSDAMLPTKLEPLELPCPLS